MAAFLAILIAVLLDRGSDYIPGGRLVLQCRNVGWFTSYSGKIYEWLGKINVTQGYLVLFGLFLPLLISLLVLQSIFVLTLGITGKVIFMGLTLFYLLGNSDTDQYESFFVRAHEKSFAVLFWFAIFGPVGAFIYWFLIVAQKVTEASEIASSLHALAAWIPARITGFVFGLVGRFTAVLKCWLVCMSNLTLPSSQVLVDCGRAAVDTSESEDEAKLVLRAYISWVVLSAVLVLFFS